MNKVSILIPYRNRREHLEILLPRLIQKFEGKDYEILILEQDDDEKFRLSSLYNIGVKYATGDILVMHDVDYYPSENVSYDIQDQPVYPVKQVIFIDWNMKEKPVEEIPTGYRHFRYDVGQHWGGVFILTREMFEMINGFNPLYIGWGKEEEDTHQRLLYYGYKPIRYGGTFFALPHDDSAPEPYDDDFIRNHKLLSQFSDNLQYGYNNIEADVTEHSLEGMLNVRWLKIKNWKLNESAFSDWNYLLANYKNTKDVHRRIWLDFKYHVNANLFLKHHRDYIVQTRSGYGNRSLHWMWKLLVDQMPNNFRFLEIGVFMGQIISLVRGLADLCNKNCSIYGITPLDSTGNHPVCNYMEEIKRVHRDLGIPLDKTTIIKGLSTDLNIIDQLYQISALDKFDMLYIDGGHSYDVVMNDLKYYTTELKVGGYLILDDASNYLDMPKGLIRMDWFGIPEVSKAVRDFLESNDEFKHLFAVGHNRVWRRVK